MAIEIKSPTFPESIADGTVANWLKQEGESVNQDEVIAEIETDKVVLEVVAPSDGFVSKILKVEGDIVNSSEVIGEFSESDATNTSQPKVEKLVEKNDMRHQQHQSKNLKKLATRMGQPQTSLSQKII